MSAADFLTTSVVIAQVLLALALVCATLRLLIGPRAQDRILALDAMYVDALLLMVTVGMRSGEPFYYEAALVIAVAGFVSTVALSRFLLRGQVIE